MYPRICTIPSFAALSKIKHDLSNKVVLKLKLQKIILT